MLKGYALAAALVVAAHAILAGSDALWGELYRLSVPTRDDALRVAANVKLAGAAGGKQTVVLIGSSQAREDFDVHFLDERFSDKRQFVNLGISGTGSPIYMYMLTPRIVDMDPDLVIYMPFIGSVFRPYAYRTFDIYFNPNVLPLIQSLYGWGELLGHADEIAMGLLGEASDLFRYRNSLQHMVKDAEWRWLRGAPPKQPQQFAYNERKPERHFQSMIRAHKDNPRYRVHRYLPLTEAAFDSMLRAFEERDIPVLVVDGPTHPLIRHIYDPSLDASYAEFMNAATAAHGFTHLEAGDLPRFRDEDFNDFTHLGDSGRARFNAFIADYLEENADRLGLGGR